MVLVAAGFIIASALFNATSRHATAVKLWSKQLSHQTLVLAEQANQSLFSVEVVLDTLSDKIIEQAVNTDQSKTEAESDRIVRQVLQDKVRANRLIEAISVVLPSGRVVSSSDHDVSHFEVERHKREFVQISPRFSSAIFLGPPRFDGKTRQWLFDLLREVKNRDGSTLAWLRVEGSLQTFSELYEKVVKDLGRGASVSLYRSDYTLMARWPSVDALVGVQNPTSATQDLIGVKKLTQGVLVTDSERMTESKSTDLRMVAVRRVEQFPLIVTSVITRDLFLKEWDDVVRKILWRSSLALLLLGLGAWWLLRSDTQLQLEL